MGDNYGISHSGHGNITSTGAVGPNATVNHNHYTTAPPRGAQDRPGAGGANSPASERADIGVLTVLSEELRAVVDVLARGDGYRRHQAADGRELHEAQLRVEGGTVHVVATQTLNRGQHSAALAYQQLQAYCAPRLVALVGIAGGIHPDLNLGDVVIGDKVVYYEGRKEATDGIHRRGAAQQVPATVQRMINNFFVRYGEPLAMVGGSGPYTVYRGPIGSGEAVVATKESPIRAYVRGFDDKTLALETEAGGIAQAYYEAMGADTTAIGWLTVRGISDLADVAKDDSHHEIAARHAAAVFERLVPFLRLPPL